MNRWFEDYLPIALGAMSVVLAILGLVDAFKNNVFPLLIDFVLSGVCGAAFLSWVFDAKSSR